MKCSKCGNEIKEGQSFCESCGNPVDLNVSEETAKVENPVMEPKKNNGNKLLILIIVAIIVIAAIAVVAILIINNNSSNGSSDDSTKSSEKSNEKNKDKDKDEKEKDKDKEDNNEKGNSSNSSSSNKTLSCTMSGNEAGMDMNAEMIVGFKNDVLEDLKVYMDFDLSSLSEEEMEEVTSELTPDQVCSIFSSSTDNYVKKCDGGLEGKKYSVEIEMDTQALYEEYEVGEGKTSIEDIKAEIEQNEGMTCKIK